MIISHRIRNLSLALSLKERELLLPLGEGRDEGLN